ncbi:hypothetical protein PC116_g12670 [Phytophthora cactorum]|nr:hypothetical protein Pcac1_g15993 [Phytophthora cactorum]KAG4239325.1 hypothetical protein PC116_g12670 [Phytophthora cactorum]
MRSIPFAQWYRFNSTCISRAPPMMPRPTVDRVPRATQRRVIDPTHTARRIMCHPAIVLIWTQQWVADQTCIALRTTCRSTYVL